MYIDLNIDPTQLLEFPVDELNNCEFILLNIRSGANPVFWKSLETKLSQLTLLNKLKGFSLEIDALNEAQDFSNIVKMPFWQKLEALHIRGEIETSCLEAILDQFQFQRNLTHLSMNETGLTPEEAEILLCKKPSALESLDLSANNIKEYSGAPNDFKNFCKEIRKSNLNELTLSSIGPKECAILSKYVKKTNRYFKLNIFPDIFLLDENLEYLTKAMYVNPYLTVEIDNSLSTLDDKKNLLVLNTQSKKNSFPRLQDLAALRLCEYLKSTSTEERKEITPKISDFFNTLSFSNAFKKQLFVSDNAKNTENLLKNPHADEQTKNTNETGLQLR